jgi:hypothetical protein
MEKRRTPVKHLPALTLLLMMHTSGSLGNVEAEDDLVKDMSAALGVAPDFSLWDGPVNLVYDPDGAPPIYSDTSEMLELLKEATENWALVSGIEFNIVGDDSEALEDESLPLRLMTPFYGFLPRSAPHRMQRLS